MKKPILFGLLLFSLMMPFPIHAEIYKYIDENGEKRWTDDLSQVPLNQRSAAKRMQGVKEDTPQDLKGSNSTDKNPPVQSSAGKIDYSKNITRESLEMEKAELDDQYKQLLEERQQLEKMKAEKLTSKARAALNQRISAYNEKTKKYEEQLNIFKGKIDAYNKSVINKQATQN